MVANGLILVVELVVKFGTGVVTGWYWTHVASRLRGGAPEGFAGPTTLGNQKAGDK